MKTHDSAKIVTLKQNLKNRNVPRIEITYITEKQGMLLKHYYANPEFKTQKYSYEGQCFRFYYYILKLTIELFHFLRWLKIQA